MTAWGPPSWKPPDGNPPFLYQPPQQQPQQQASPASNYAYQSLPSQPQPPQQHHLPLPQHQQPHEIQVPQVQQQQQPLPSSSWYNYQAPPPPPYQSSNQSGSFPSHTQQQPQSWDNTSHWHPYYNEPSSTTTTNGYPQLGRGGYDPQPPQIPATTYPSLLFPPAPLAAPPPQRIPTQTTNPPHPATTVLRHNPYNNNTPYYAPPSTSTMGRGMDAVRPAWMTTAKSLSSSFQPSTTSNAPPPLLQPPLPPPTTTQTTTPSTIPYYNPTPPPPPPLGFQTAVGETHNNTRTHTTTTPIPQQQPSNSAPPQTVIPMGRGWKATQPAWMTRRATTNTPTTSRSSTPTLSTASTSLGTTVGSATSGAAGLEKPVTTNVAGSIGKSATSNIDTKAAAGATTNAGPAPVPALPQRGYSIASGTNHNGVWASTTTMGTASSNLKPQPPTASTMTEEKDDTTTVAMIMDDEDDNELEFVVCVAIDRTESAIRQYDDSKANNNAALLRQAMTELQQLVQRIDRRRRTKSKNATVEDNDTSTNLQQVVMEAEALLQRVQQLLQEATNVHPNPETASGTGVPASDGRLIAAEGPSKNQNEERSISQTVPSEEQNEMEVKAIETGTGEEGAPSMEDVVETAESSCSDQIDQAAAQVVMQDKVKDARVLAKTKLAKAKLKVGLLKAKAKLLESQKQQQQQQQQQLPPDPVIVTGPHARIPKISALRLPLTLRIDTSNEPERVVLIPVVDEDGIKNDTGNDYSPPGPAVKDDLQLQAVLSQIPSLPWHPRLRRKRPRDDDDDAEGDETSTKLPKLSREDLLQRRQQAEQKKAVLLCKNLIVKHEVLEAEQRAKLQTTQQALERTQDELHQLENDIQRNQCTIESLTVRKQVIDELTHDYVTKLVNARKALHEHNLAMEGSEVG